MILLLAAAGVLSWALGDVTEAIVILVVVAGTQGSDSARSTVPRRPLPRCRLLTTPTVSVGRGWTTQEIPARERASMAYADTSIAAGRGTTLVIATGMETELGRVAGLLRAAGPGKTPMQHRLDGLVRRLALAAAGIVGLVFPLQLVRHEPLDTLLLTAVSLAVAAVPESLPAVVTITLALGAQRMLRRHAIGSMLLRVPSSISPRRYTRHPGGADPCARSTRASSTLRRPNDSPAGDELLSTT